MLTVTQMSDVQYDYFSRKIDKSGYVSDLNNKQNKSLVYYLKAGSSAVNCQVETYFTHLKKVLPKKTWSV